MDTETKQQIEQTTRFMQGALNHISQATEKQKEILLKAILERPPPNAAVAIAEQIWSGLTEKEFMSLCASIQKRHNKDFWIYATRWRT